MSIFKTKKFKSLLLLPLAAFAVATPIVMTSCSNASTSTVDSRDNVNDNNNPNNNTSSSNTEDYSSEQMVEYGTNNTELSENQKTRQDNKANKSLNEFGEYSKLTDKNEIDQTAAEFTERSINFSLFYVTNSDTLTNLLYNSKVTNDDFKNFLLVVAKAYKDARFEYGFVSKSEYTNSYKEKYENFLKVESKVNFLENDNYSYTSFVYNSYVLSAWGDYMNHEYLQKRSKGNTYIISPDIPWYYENAKGNIKNEIDKYNVIYQELIK